MSTRTGPATPELGLGQETWVKSTTMRGDQMPIEIGRQEVQRLVAEEQAQLVEVLPRAEYDWAQLRGALHLHLKDLGTRAARRLLRRDRPIVVYCNDFQ